MILNIHAFKWNEMLPPNVNYQRDNFNCVFCAATLIKHGDQNDVRLQLIKTSHFKRHKEIATGI